MLKLGFYIRLTDFVSQYSCQYKRWNFNESAKKKYQSQTHLKLKALWEHRAWALFGQVVYISYYLWQYCKLLSYSFLMISVRDGIMCKINHKNSLVFNSLLTSSKGYQCHSLTSQWQEYLRIVLPKLNILLYLAMQTLETLGNKTL